MRDGDRPRARGRGRRHHRPGLGLLLRAAPRHEEGERGDREHGRRAADFARGLHGGVLLLDERRFDTLTEALGLHAGRVSSDPTVGTCWDTDRLHLPACRSRPIPCSPRRPRSGRSGSPRPVVRSGLPPRDALITRASGRSSAIGRVTPLVRRAVRGGAVRRRRERRRRYLPVSGSTATLPARTRHRLATGFRARWTTCKAQPRRARTQADGVGPSLGGAPTWIALPVGRARRADIAELVRRSGPQAEWWVGTPSSIALSLRCVGSDQSARDGGVGRREVIRHEERVDPAVAHVMPRRDPRARSRSLVRIAGSFHGNTCSSSLLTCAPRDQATAASSARPMPCRRCVAATIIRDLRRARSPGAGHAPGRGGQRSGRRRQRRGRLHRWRRTTFRYRRSSAIGRHASVVRSQPAARGRPRAQGRRGQPRPPARLAVSRSWHHDPVAATTWVAGRAEHAVRPALDRRHAAEEEVAVGPASDDEAVLLERGRHVVGPPPFDVGRFPST